MRKGLTAPEATVKRDMSPIISAQDQKLSPLLRLPAEIRNQIYTYLDFGGHTIEVLHTSDKTINILDGKGARIQSTSSVTWDRLFFRIELTDESKYTYAPPKTALLSIGQRSRAYRTKRKRCASLLGLFAVPHVCRQLRQETMLLPYELNTFAFTDDRLNYSTALPSWLASLGEREKGAVRSICWPLRQSREYQRTLNGIPIRAPDRDCSAELSELRGLTDVVLRWVATSIDNGALSASEAVELEEVYARSGGQIYQLEREFRRRLAVRGMQKQVMRDGVRMRYEKTWRAAF